MRLGKDAHALTDFFRRYRHKGKPRLVLLGFESIKGLSGHKGYVMCDRGLHEFCGVDCVGEIDPDKHASQRLRPGYVPARGHKFLECLKHHRALVLVDRAHLGKVFGQKAASEHLSRNLLRECGRMKVQGLLKAREVIEHVAPSADVSEAQARGKNFGEGPESEGSFRSPGSQGLRRRLVVPEFAVGIVLHKPEVVFTALSAKSARRSSVIVRPVGFANVGIT